MLLAFLRCTPHLTNTQTSHPVLVRRICSGCQRIVPAEQTTAGRCGRCYIPASKRRDPASVAKDNARKAARPLHKMLWNTSQWKRFRISILERDEYTCQLAKPGCTVTATSVHHILPAATYTAGWYDPDNCISLCARCHGRTDGRRSKLQGGGVLSVGGTRPASSHTIFTDSWPKPA